MPATIIPQPIPSTAGVTPSQVAVATSNQQSRIGQATRAGAGQSGGARIVSASGSISSTDTYVGADTSGAAVTLTLPKVSEYRSLIVYVEQYVAGHTLTLAARSGDTIDGAATLTVTKMVKVFPVSNSDFHAVVIGA